MQDSDSSSSVFDTNDDEISIFGTKRPKLKSGTREAVCNEIGNKSQNTFMVKALVHSPQHPSAKTIPRKLYGRPKVITNTNDRKLMKTKQKPVSEIVKDCMDVIYSVADLNQQRIGRETFARKKSLHQNPLPKTQTDSESLNSSFISSDSEESLIRTEKTSSPNFEVPVKRDEMTRKKYVQVSRTPSSGYNFRTKRNKWPSPVALLQSKLIVKRKENFGFKNVEHEGHNIICSTPLTKANLRVESEWPSPVQKIPLESPNTRSRPPREEEESFRIEPTDFLEGMKELRLLRRRSTLIQSSDTSAGTTRLKKTVPESNEKVKNIDHEEIVATTGVRTRQTEPNFKSPILGKRKSPRKQKEINGAEGRSKRHAASADDEMNRKKAKKNNNNARKKTGGPSRSSSSNRKKKNDEVPKNLEGARRSTRTRIKPLAHWTGERVKYEWDPDNSGKRIVAVNPGRSAEPDFVQKKRKKMNLSIEELDIQSLDVINEINPERKLVPIPYKGKEREIECFSTLRLEVDDYETNKNFSLYTGIEVPGVDAGYITIAPFSYVKDRAFDNMHFVFSIVSGRLSVTVHNTTKEMGKGEIFYVSKGISYKIKNLDNSEAVLFFTKMEIEYGEVNN